MAPDLVLDPAELSAAAGAVEALLPALRPARMASLDLDVLAALPGAAVVVAELARLLHALTRVEAEMAELAAGLRAVAVAAESAERDSLRTVTAADR